MKGLRKYISPFTPDQSGAVSVIYDYGGMIIIMDAGGCVGNICGYDEPRWETHTSAIFSAGLRDLDAILGRDDLLIEKTGQALKDVDAKFVSLIGTPVPEIIATDFRALKRLMEKEYGIPVIPIGTNGMDLYDLGQQKAYMEMIETFMGNKEYESKNAGDVGILGATPLDTVSVGSPRNLRFKMIEKGFSKPICFGDGSTLSDFADINKLKQIYVVSPSGLKAARMLEKEYGIPYTVEYPLTAEETSKFRAKISSEKMKKVLIVHQQVFANEIRKIVKETGSPEIVDVASWFIMDDEIKEDRDIKFIEEDDIIKLVQENEYDMIIGDPLFKRALPKWEGKFIDLPHFAVSGELHNSKTDEEYWSK